jgi:hypothetical protein
MKVVIYTDGKRTVSTTSPMLHFANGEIQETIDIPNISNEDADKLLANPYDQDLIDKYTKTT